jgi:ATP-binding cassette subfamily B protein
MQMMVNMLLRMFLRSPGMLIGALVMAITLRPSLAVVLAVTIPLMLCSILIVIMIGFPRFGRVQKKLDGLNATVQENVTNVRVVKSFVREDFEKDKFRTANRELKETSMSATKVMIFMSPVMTLFMNITTIAVLWFGAPMVQSGMEIGDLSAFITYVTQILSSLMMVTMMLMMSSRALASAKRVREVLEEPLDLTDTASADREATVTRGEIEFRGVTFRYYKDSEDPVLDRIDLKIPEIGWNALDFGGKESPLWKYIKEGDYVYFVHSFYGKDCDEAVIATTEYGVPLTAAVQNGNVYGTQFHPEKSGNVGLSILRAFCEL